MAAGVGRPDRPRIKWLDGHRRALVVPVCGVVAFKMRQVAADDEAYIVGPDARDHRSDGARGKHHIADEIHQMGGLEIA